MGKKFLAALAGAAALACAGQASAATILATFTGTVSGIDAWGSFGVTGTDLTGETFTASYVLDTDAPGGFVFHTFYGASWQHMAPLAASLTIDGTTVNWGPSDHAQWGLHVNTVTKVVTSGIDVSTVNGPAMGIEYSPPADLPYMIGEPYSGPACAGGGSCVGEFTGGGLGVLFLNPLSATITVDGVLPDDFAAIPEPASWAMMLIGLFGLGGALRSRRPIGVLSAS
ncbi:MAG: PEP-CTERM sorting domain-containing protein [Caulobacteraceae bacterium]